MEPAVRNRANRNFSCVSSHPSRHFLSAMADSYPLVIRGIGIVAIIGMITILRLNAFIFLITSAIIVSLLTPVR